MGRFLRVEVRTGRGVRARNHPGTLDPYLEARSPSTLDPTSKQVAPTRAPSTLTSRYCYTPSSLNNPGTLDPYLEVLQHPRPLPQECVIQLFPAYLRFFITDQIRCTRQPIVRLIFRLPTQKPNADYSFQLLTALLAGGDAELARGWWRSLWFLWPLWLLWPLWFLRGCAVHGPFASDGHRPLGGRQPALERGSKDSFLGDCCLPDLFPITRKPSLRINYFRYYMSRCRPTAATEMTKQTGTSML